MDPTGPPPLSSGANPPAPANLRLMCSYGGHIVPRPHDKSLCYVGGDTRIVVVDRHTTLANLLHRLCKTLLRSSSSTTSFTLKYQLPSEDLDSLISVTTDEDLENMIDEYEKLSKSSRIRLFVFPAKPESGSSIGSVLENCTKSEDWFVNVLNGSTSGLSDCSSVNCLLGLEDDVPVPEKKGHDVHSIPDSPMMETTSSFGSASSSRIVNGDDHAKVGGAPVSSAGVIPYRGFTDDERSELGSQMTHLKHRQQKQSMGFDLASPDSVLSDGNTPNSKPPINYQEPILQIQPSNNTNRASDPKNTHDQNTTIQQIQVPAYLQPQFVHTTPPQYLHHHPSGAVPMPSYYPIYQPPTDQQNFVYYMSARAPPQVYNFPLHHHQQPSPATTAPPPNNQAPPPHRPTDPRAPQLQGQYIYYAPQPQYRTMTPASSVEAGYRLPIDNNMKQQP